MKILMANCTKMVNDSGGVAKVACAFSNAISESSYFVLIGL